MALFPWLSEPILDAVESVQKREVKAAQTVADFPDSIIQQIMTGGSSPAVIGDASVQKISRELAMSVPAVRRGLQLKCSTLAAMPLIRRNAIGERIALGWLAQPEANRPAFNTWFDVSMDLELDGVAYLRVHSRDASGQPAFGGVEYIELKRITTSTVSGKTQIRIDGVLVSPLDIIGFEGLGAGILTEGARIIRTAISLEAAAKRYADSPRPGRTFVNASGYEMSDEEMDALVATIKANRNQDSDEIVNAALTINANGWDSAQLQLVEARQFTATQLANVVGVPARYIAGAAASSGGTVTYANVTQDAREFVDYSLKPLANVIEARLSLTDAAGAVGSYQVTPRGQSVKFDMDSLLRGNASERAAIYSQLIPLGVLTIDEARQMEDMI